MNHFFSPSTFALLEELAENNTREWYHEHKTTFEKEVRTPFLGLIEAITDELGDSSLPLIGNKKTMFRQNRDVRFSKDKSPYQTHVSGLLTPSGSKNEDDGILYCQINKSGGMMACGYYKLPTARLKLIREKIIDEAGPFKEIMDDLEGKNLSLIEDGKLSSMPRGFSEYSDHELAEYLKMKSFATHHSFTKQQLLEEDLVAHASQLAIQTQPLVDFCKME
ncbi:MAG: DUF2461 domain-containing protein [Bacteroidota bacterium]